MLNDIDFYSNTNKVDYYVNASIEIFGENVPYTIQRILGTKVVVFNEHFIRTAREAFTTDCVAKMNSAELDLLERYIAYTAGSIYRDITVEDSDVMEALDLRFMNALNCVVEVGINDCYDNATHTWLDCTN